MEPKQKREPKTGEGRFDLIPTIALRRLAKLFESDAAKYGERDWEQNIPLNQFVNNALYHINKLLAGDTSEDHAISAAWNMIVFVTVQAMIAEGRLSSHLNNMPLPEPKQVEISAITVTAETPVLTPPPPPPPPLALPPAPKS